MDSKAFARQMIKCLDVLETSPISTSETPIYLSKSERRMLREIMFNSLYQRQEKETS